MTLKNLKIGEHAREYLYSISNRKRIYNWFDVETGLM